MKKPKKLMQIKVIGRRKKENHQKDINQKKKIKKLMNHNFLLKKENQENQLRRKILKEY